jgi:intracellular sulfur oxidation DsrE/DsrF family protein
MKRDIIILLHGECLKYGLKSKVYRKTYGCRANPFAPFLLELRRKQVQIRICNLCLMQDGFDEQDLLEFVVPVPFSIDYLLQEEDRGAKVVYDSTLEEHPKPCLGA